MKWNTLGGMVLAAGIMAAGPVMANEVNIYNSRHYNTDRALYEEFTRATGIKVNMVEGDHDQLIQRIKAEGANSPADLLITVDAGRLAFAANEGLLAPVRSAALDSAIPAHLRDPEGLWYGLSSRARVLVYARDRVKPADLGTYEDLADPRWRGKLLTRSSTNSYSIGLTASILAANGEEATEKWARGIVANLARPPKGGDTDQIRAVAAGEGDVALSNSYYLAKLMVSEKPEDKAVVEKVGVFFPNQNNRGTHMNVSGAGLVKTAPNKDNAVRLLEYLVSPPAQRYFADGNLEYPANPTVPPHPVLGGFGSFKQDPINAAQYAKNSQKALQIMDRAGWK